MRSIELNFLSRLNKDLPLPEVRFAPLKSAGLYVGPWHDVYKLDNEMIESHHGLIIVNPECNDDESTIIHEWRHHWQAYHLGVDLFYESTQFNSNAPYWPEIRRFFRNNWIEFDALRFQMKKCPTELTRRWWHKTHE